MTQVKFNNNAVARNFDNLFDDFFGAFPAVLNNNWKTDLNHFPQVNIHESKDGFHLELNAPGRNKEDFNIVFEKGLLTISYEQKEEKKQEDYKTLRREFVYRGFKRSFSIDDTIQTENIQAKYENGVLKLYLPKKEEGNSTTKQINVQ